ncbi:27S pre-rRNA (guanosine(2922)-2'-O)-methyltransferase, partial [Smittium mucronatum]
YRNVSAEIFVVCQNFIAPKKLDPKFLDPKYVFEDLEVEKPKASIDIFAPEKKQKKRHREGYEEGNYSQHKKRPVMDFITDKDPASVLGSCNELVFEGDGKELVVFPETNQDIIISCQDLRVLGKKDFRTLMKWRLIVRKRLDLDKKEAESNTQSVEIVKDSEDDSGEELDLLSKLQQKKARKERRKINEKRQKQVIKMQMNMTTPMDIGLDQGDETLFSVKKKSETNVSNSDSIRKLTKEVDMDAAADLAELADSDEDLEFYQEDESIEAPLDPFGKVDKEKLHSLALEKDLDSMYETYTSKIRERDSKLDIKKKRSMEGEFRGFSSEDGEDSDSKPQKKKKSRSFGVADNDLDVDSRRERNLDIDDTDSDSSDYNSRQVPENASDDSDDELDILEMKKQAKKDKADLRNKKLLGANVGDSTDSGAVTMGKLSKKASLWFDQPLFKDLSVNSILQSQKQAISSEPSVPKKKKKADANLKDQSKKEISGLYVLKNDDIEDDELEVEALAPQVEEFVDPNEDANDETDYSAFATAEALTLAHDLINKKVSKSDLIDKYFNRHSHNDMDELPAWFVENERQFNRPNLPITKEAVDMLRAKLKAIDARPIKKIVEAKARKKLHANQRLEKLKAKAESMANNDDMTEAEKAKNIDKLMKSNINKAANKKNKVKVVVAKGGNRGLKGRPKGTKGRYKMVDRRLKKDARAEKVKAKRGKKK